MNVWPFIEAEKAEHHGVKRACELLEVSRAAFYECAADHRNPALSITEIPQVLSGVRWG